MGVVYKAEDLQLGRFVAVKFVRSEAVQDQAAAERFRREARAASALNHPNICTIHEFGDHDGQQYLAMELLDGETLRKTIADAPLKLEAMLTIEDRQPALLITSGGSDNNDVRIAVSDNGPGIDSQTAHHLFDAFSTTKPDGMGMGLAISRSIIEAHGGRLWTEANDEFGATFQFTLPIAAN